MVTDVHDAITSLAAHGKELPVGLTQEMKDEVEALVGGWGGWGGLGGAPGRPWLTGLVGGWGG